MFKKSESTYGFLSIVLFVVMVLVSMPTHSAKFVVASDGFVSGFFIVSNAVYDSDLSLMADGYADPIVSISSRGSELGEITTFGWYEAGTELTFNLFVHDTGYTYYSDQKLNSDGISHISAFQFAFPSGTLSVFKPTVFIGFKDSHGGGDMDFNDNMAIFTNVAIMAAVPEPETYAMLLLGLALIGYRVKSTE